MSAKSTALDDCSGAADCPHRRHTLRVTLSGDAVEALTDPRGPLSSAAAMSHGFHPRESACIDADTAAGYVAGGLAPADVLATDQHVDVCANCRRLLRAAALSTGGEGGAIGQRTSSIDVVALPPGMQIGRYVVEGPLGVGAMGVVVRALDPELGRSVALKRVRVDVAETEAWQERLRREARAMARLSHPNVVAVYDLVVHDGRTFIAMELIEGVSLRAWLAERKRVWREIVEVFLQAARGLAAAHGVGLVHRDFKPENVLRSRHGRVCVTDFGLARPADLAEGGADGSASDSVTVSGERSKRTSAIVGTPAYMAPEQAQGESADARSDQFSFCVALHEALHGELPRTRDDALPSDARERGAAPPWVRKILVRGLMPSPDARYPSMDDLIADLARDRRARRLRVVAVAGVVASAACVLLAYRHGLAASNVSTCHGSSSRLAGVWDAARAQGVRDALLATNKPYSADAWRGVERTLDEYASAWGAAHDDACEATQIRGEQSTEAMDLRMACLGDRLQEMNALVDVLSHADEAVVSHARSAAGSLSPISSCGNVPALRAKVKPPTDAAKAARVDELWGDLRRAKAMAMAGKLHEALPIAASASSAADGIGYLPLQAEASYRFGGLQAMTGDLEHAQAELLRALHFADAAADDRTRAEVCRMLYYYASRQGKPELMPVYRDEALATIEREGGDAQAEARLFVAIAGAQTEIGQYAEAKVTAERAVALTENAFGADARPVADALVNLGIAYGKLGATVDAHRVLERAREIVVALLGAEHPDVAVVESDLADVLLAGLDLTGAESHYDRAIFIAEASWGKEHYRVGRYVHGLGETLILQKRYAEAEAVEGRALAISEKSLGPRHARLVEPLWGLGEALLGEGRPRDALAPLERALTIPPSDEALLPARAKYALARALAATGGDARRARTLAVEAVGVFEHTPASPRMDALLADARAWLGAHAGPR
jgi:eukaryotic-like serine/threonine-protein kinase